MGRTVYKSLTILAIISASIFLFFQTPSEKTDREDELRTFKSEGEFQDYIEKSGTSDYYGSPTRRDDLQTSPEFESPASGGSEKVERYSETNIQVKGIDEPDILKTKGRNIFYSSESYWQGNTTIIDGLPADKPSKKSSLKDKGNLLIENSTLLVLENDQITSYNVENVSEPVKKWSKSFNGSIDTARMFDGELYMINRQDVNQDNPCPIRPVSSDREVTIPCTSIYRPPRPVDRQTTYTAMKLSPETGGITEKTSFVASRYNTITYMSENGLYLTYTTENSQSEMMLSYLLESGSEHLNQQTVQRLKDIDSYDISENSKMNEIDITMENYFSTLSGDKRKEVESRIENGLRKFSKQRMREFQRTGIVKMSTDNLEISSEGEVPGEPLNQFSLDEHNNHIRIATTVTGPFGNVESENDIYTLDSDLEKTGQITGMGLDERVYSARFVGDKGYLVTFKRIDPFHVLDLSDPENPVLEGELKLPGYSSYLHPIDDETVLGIGEESGKVKVVIFDVSDPENPETADDFVVDEHFSEIGQTHHAFMIDRKHGVFFLPASTGGYIFSYEDQELELVKAVEMNDPNRATYINDYMYLLSDTEMVVLDENTWERASKLKIREEENRPVYREPVLE